MVRVPLQSTPGPIHRYGDEEVAQILTEAHSGVSLEGLHCPRDHQALRVFFAKFAPHQPGDGVQGVLHGEWGDVTMISVACPACQTDRARISLRRSGRE